MSEFKTIPEDRIIYRGKNFFIIEDKFPVSPGHLLIISNEEKLDYFSLDHSEHQELPELIIIAKEIIEKQYQPLGFNIGINCGEVAGQTVMHFHCHVIPRYRG